MVEQYKKEEKLADILIVYGYHENETFHQDIVTQLKKKNIPNVRYVKYDWKRPHNNKRNVYLAFNKFTKHYLPADHVIDLHDTPNVKDTKDQTMDYFWFFYDSLASRSKELKHDLYLLGKDLEKIGGRKVFRSSYMFPPDYSAKFPLYVVELFPKIVTRHEAVMQIEGLISILQKHPKN